MRPVALAAVVAVALLAGCSDDTGSSASTSTATTTTTPVSSSTTGATTTAPATTVGAPDDGQLDVLVTNDDGIGAPGIDALVAALSSMPDTTVTVVAPADNKSGSSDTTTPGAPGSVTSSAATTASGVAGTAVQGFPADSVLVALDTMSLRPDVVVSGVNLGQNVGPFVSLSGTVGAARTAARRGIPAIAVSAGADDASRTAAAQLAVAQVTALRAGILDGSATATVTNINVPTCSAGSVRGVVDVPVATAFPDGVTGLDVTTDCSRSVPAGTDDITALLSGHASRSVVEPG